MTALVRLAAAAAEEEANIGGMANDRGKPAGVGWKVWADAGPRDTQSLGGVSGQTGAARGCSDLRRGSMRMSALGCRFNQIGPVVAVANEADVEAMADGAEYPDKVADGQGEACVEDAGRMLARCSGYLGSTGSESGRYMFMLARPGSHIVMADAENGEGGGLCERGRTLERCPRTPS